LLKKPLQENNQACYMQLFFPSIPSKILFISGVYFLQDLSLMPNKSWIKLFLKTYFPA